jgi:hypothetical protein
MSNAYATPEAMANFLLKHMKSRDKLNEYLRVCQAAHQRVNEHKMSAFWKAVQDEVDRVPVGEDPYEGQWIDA